MSNFKNKLNHIAFRKSFLTYLLLLILVAIITVTIFFTILRTERKKQSIVSCEEYSKRINLIVSNQFNAIHNVTNSLRNSSWVSKYMSTLEIINDEFDILKQNDISADLITITAANDIIHDVVIIYPYKEVVVSYNGWWNLQEYMRYTSNQYGIEEKKFSDMIYSNSNNYGVLSSQNFSYQDKNYMMIVQELEMVSKPRAIALITLKKQALVNQLTQIINDKIVSIEITDNKIGSLVKINSNISITSNYSLIKSGSSLLFQTKIDFYIDPVQLNKKDFIQLSILLLTAIFISIIVSYILALISYLPLSKLLSKINANYGNKYTETDNEYQYIEESIQKIYDENINMQNIVDLYKTDAKNNVYHQLLKGYFITDNAHDLLEKYDILYSDDQYYAVIIIVTDQIEYVSEYTGKQDSIMELKAKVMLSCDYAIKSLKINAKIVDTLEDHIAIILCFPSVPTQNDLYDYAVAINDSINQISKISTDSFVSKIHPGIIGISISYQEARESTKSLVKGLDRTGILMARFTDNIYYYPTDWEQQLILNLKAGNMSVVKTIISELEKENKGLAISDEVMNRLIHIIFETIIRIAYEMNLNINQLIKIIESTEKNRWELVYDAAFYICEKIVEENTQMIMGINDQILEYINQNYCDSNLSLKTISVRFNMSVASVSRIFKEVTNINFHDYITNLRMQKAKELLRTCGYDVKNISQAVGYDNEYSFKRAFLRVEKLKPREYVENIRMAALK